MNDDIDNDDLSWLSEDDEPEDENGEEEENLGRTLRFPQGLRHFRTRNERFLVL